METSGLQSHSCHICNRKYKRPEHLHRHLSSHSTHRAYSCELCGNRFSRSDALKRHLRTCTVSETPASRLSSKRRACDRCVRLKRACSAVYPCQTCIDREADCSFSIHESIDPVTTLPIKDIDTGSADAEHVRTSLPFQLLEEAQWFNTDEPSLIDLANHSWSDFLSLNPLSKLQSGELTKTSLRFLDNFTKQTGLIKSFDCGTQEQRQMILNHALQHPYQSMVVEPFQHEQNCVIDPLSMKTYEVRALIKEVTTLKPKNGAVDLTWSDAVEDSCTQFFSATSLRKFLALYWSIWHPNVNIVHRPTFDPTCAKTVLLAAMVVIGASVSPNETDRQNASFWFNAVEETIFTDDDFCDDEPENLRDFPDISKIQAMQAAYVVCLYQNWEGTDKNKRRIRRHRFSSLVSGTRDIGLANARHLEHFNRDLLEFDWYDFAAREQLIRVFLWTFLLDTAFVIFNNLPPRMVIKEMEMNTACCEAIFQATSAEDCLSLLKEQALRCHIVSFYNAAETLCRDELDNNTYQQLANLGPLNLFAITSALHSMIFQYQSGFSSENQLVPIRNALENWKTVWTLYVHEYAAKFEHDPLRDQFVVPENMWKRIGFMRHASEYWLLASLKLDRMHVSTQQPYATVQCAAKTNPIAESSSGGALRPMLQKYDETSMGQLNDLIAEFQRTTIS